jgi:hypothetical protein
VDSRDAMTPFDEDTVAIRGEATTSIGSARETSPFFSREINLSIEKEKSKQYLFTNYNQRRVFDRPILKRWQQR